MMLHPSRASVAAMDIPIPLVKPVIKATLFVGFMKTVSLNFDLSFGPLAAAKGDLSSSQNSQPDSINRASWYDEPRMYPSPTDLSQILCRTL
jgi:hypothetical protein